MQAYRKDTVVISCQLRKFSLKETHMLMLGWVFVFIMISLDVTLGVKMCQVSISMRGPRFTIQYSRLGDTIPGISQGVHIYIYIYTYIYIHTFPKNTFLSMKNLDIQSFACMDTLKCKYSELLDNTTSVGPSQ